MTRHPFHTRSHARSLALALSLILAPAVAGAQEIYPSPEAASQALIAAARSGERGFLDRIFGPGARDLISSGDEEEDRRRLAVFLRSADEATRLEPRGDDARNLVLGSNQWPFPIPIVKRDQGWSFDLEAGRSEVLHRTIGFNELSAIEACRTYVEAQKEYFRQDRDGDELQEYARRFISTPGKRDGLYWTPENQADRSPLDGRFSEATINRADRAAPYRGYHYKILTRQGPAAPGGEFSYLVNGNMLAGFALVAFPAEWGKTGVMTFICNMQGRVYQRDLGPDTLNRARAMTTYNPSQSWTLVE